MVSRLLQELEAFLLYSPSIVFLSLGLHCRLLLAQKIKKLFFKENFGNNLLQGFRWKKEIECCKFDNYILYNYKYKIFEYPTTHHLEVPEDKS